MKNNIQPDFRGVIAQQTDATIQRIFSGITNELMTQMADSENRQAGHSLSMAESRQKQHGDMIKAVKSIQPAIEKAVIYSMQKVIGDIGKLEKLDDLKGMVGGIKIPDYSNRLDSLDKAVAGTVKAIPKTDLAPIMSQLDTISTQIIDMPGEDRPKSWQFVINRDDRTKLIESVDVRAEN